MKAFLAFALLAALAFAYWRRLPVKPVPAPAATAPTSTPQAATPTAPAAPAPPKPVIVQQHKALPVPRMPAPKDEDIRQGNGFMPVPFRSAPSPGATQVNAPLHGKVNAVEGKPVTALPPGVKLISNPTKPRATK